MILPTGQFRFVFTAGDYPASLAFYRDGLGLPVDHDWDYGPADRGTVFLAGGGMIEIFAPAPGVQRLPPQGISMSIEVESADAWYQRARERGLKVIAEPATYPWGHRIVRLEDPDGIAVSLFNDIIR